MYQLQLFRIMFPPKVLWILSPFFFQWRSSDSLFALKTPQFHEFPVSPSVCSIFFYIRVSTNFSSRIQCSRTEACTELLDAVFYKVRALLVLFLKYLQCDSYGFYQCIRTWSVTVCCHGSQHVSIIERFPWLAP